MGTMKGRIVFLCISFLVITWPDESLGAPASALPFLQQYLTSSLGASKQTSSTSSLSSCKLRQPSSSSQSTSSDDALSISFIPEDNPTIQKQRLVNQVVSLLKQLSDSVPVKSLVNSEIQEKFILQNLIDQLEDFKNNNVVVAPNSSSNLPAISGSTYNSMMNEYHRVRLLALNSLTPGDSQNILSALEDLHKTFTKIVTGQLLNAELPNLCSKILALNNQIDAIDTPTELQDALTAFMTSLTVALTGQSQVTISGLCNCLNDLETSIVTVVENDKSQRLQYLLSSLVDAVTNAVVSGGDVGCNVVEIVQRYVNSIKQAVQEETNVRAGKIYSSVLDFEEELYKVLVASDPTAISITSPSQYTGSSTPQTEKEYLAEIEQLIKKVSDYLTRVHRTEKPSTTKKADFEAIISLLRIINSNPGKYTTQVGEALTELVKNLIKTNAPEVSSTSDNVSEIKADPETIEDATDIVRNGESFILRENLIRETDANENVIDIVRTGLYNLVDPNTFESWSGSYAVENVTIKSNPDGTTHIESSGIYNVNPSEHESTSTVSRVKREGKFVITKDVIVEVDEDGNTKTTETGRYLLTDPATARSKSGNFEVTNIALSLNPDGSIDVIKSGVLYVDEPGLTSPIVRPSDNSSFGDLLFEDHIFEKPDSQGNLGTGIYTLKRPNTGGYESGTYVIKEFGSTTNADGITESTKSGVIYVDNSYPDSITENFNPLLIITNGSSFTFNDHLDYVTDDEGNVLPSSTGEFIQNDPSTGMVSVGNYVVQNTISTENPDGSIDITTSVKFSDIAVALSSTGSNPLISSPETNETTETAKTTGHPGAKPSKMPSKTDDPSAQDSPSSTGNDNGDPTYDATSIVTSGTTFIISELITPLREPGGRVYDAIKAGTYHLMDIKTNTSWLGAYEIKSSSSEKVSPGKTNKRLSGTFDIAPPANSWRDATVGEFLIEDELVSEADVSGAKKITETGTYQLTDPATGATNCGTFVVENTISKKKPGGAIEIIRSGYLLVDESHSTSPSPSGKPLIPGYEGYCLFDEHISPIPDKHGNYGIGFYSIKDPKMQKHTSGSYAITHASTTRNENGTYDEKTEGVIHADRFIPEAGNSDSAYPFAIINGAAVTVSNQLTPVTDSYSHISLIGNGELTQKNPENKQTQSGSYVILNTVRTINRDGSKNVKTFGVFANVDDASTTTEVSATTTEACADDYTTTETTTTTTTRPTTKTTRPTTTTTRPTTISTHPTTTTPAPTKQPEPCVLNPNLYETLVKSLNPMDPVDLKNVPDKMSSKSTEKVQSIPDATAIVTNGSLFIVDGLIVPGLDAEGNIVGQVKTGSYRIRDPKTNVSWSGNFNAADCLIMSSIEGQTNLMGSGTFDVVIPKNGDSHPKNTANFVVEDRINVIRNEIGILNTTETGTYSLTNPKTDASNLGDFVVENSIVRKNSDGSIKVVKSGTLYVDKTRAPFTTCKTRPAGNGAYFLFDEHLMESCVDGYQGNGLYNIKDQRTNEFISGPYLIKNVSKVANADGSEDTRMSGVFFVDSSRSSIISDNSDPTLSIITDGAEFECVTHVTYAVDPFGHINAAGTGVVTVTDPETQTSNSLNYIIRDITTNNNPDGGQDIIKTGIFYSTNLSTTTTRSSSSSDTHSKSSSPSNNDSKSSVTKKNTQTLSEVKESLQALIESLDVLKSLSTSTSNKGSSGANGDSTSPSMSDPGVSTNYVTLPRSNVVSAINGQCPTTGDVVVIETNGGSVLLAVIQDPYSPVTFHVTSLAEVTEKLAEAQKVWIIPENDFSKQDRSLFDVVLKSTSAPCDT